MLKFALFCVLSYYFLLKYLPAERGMSENSIKSYRDTFVLLIRYFSEEKHIPVNKITLDKIDRDLVCSFLSWLQNVKCCSSSSRNTRLAALRSFFTFLEYEDPGRIHQAQKILSIPIKKVRKRVSGIYQLKVYDSCSDSLTEIHKKEGGILLC